MTEKPHHSLLNCLQRLPDEDNAGVQNACGQHRRQTWQISFYHGCDVIFAKITTLQVQCSACFAALPSTVADRTKWRRQEGGLEGERNRRVGGVENDDSCLQPIDHTNEPPRSAKPTCRNPRLGRHLSRAKNLVNLSLPFCPCPKPGGGEGPLLGLLRFCPLPCPCRCWLCCWWECATKAAYLTCKWALNQ